MPGFIDGVFVYGSGRVVCLAGRTGPERLVMEARLAFCWRFCSSSAAWMGAGSPVELDIASESATYRRPQKWVLNLSSGLSERWYKAQKQAEPLSSGALRQSVTY